MSIENKASREQFIDYSTGNFRQRFIKAGQALFQLAASHLETSGVVPTDSDGEKHKSMQETGIAIADAMDATLQYRIAREAFDASRETAGLIYDRDYVSTGKLWPPPETENEK